jgi:hypothetical protein
LSLQSFTCSGAFEVVLYCAWALLCLHGYLGDRLKDVGAFVWQHETAAPLSHRLLDGASVVVKTFATNEIQIRLAGGQGSIAKKPVWLQSPAKRVRGDDALDLCEISQTDLETGEIYGKSRNRLFTTYGRHTLREAGAELETWYGKRVYFITLTLPGDTPQAIEALAKFDKEIRNAFLQTIRTVFKRVCTSPRQTLDYVLVSELQERGAIHLHFAVGLPNERFAKIVKVRYRHWWHQLLEIYSEKSGADLFTDMDGKSWRGLPNRFLVDCSLVHKSIRNYLSKYLSKNASKFAQGTVNSPSRWWSISCALRKKVEAKRLKSASRKATWKEAQEAVEKASEVLRQNGVEVKPMFCRWTGLPLGVIFFPPEEKKMWFYEWCKLLVSTKLSVEVPPHYSIFFQGSILAA